MTNRTATATRIDLANITDRDRTEAMAAVLDGYARGAQLDRIATSAYTLRESKMLTSYVSKIRVEVVDTYTIRVTGPAWRGGAGTLWHSSLTRLIDRATELLEGTPVEIDLYAGRIDTEAVNVERFSWTA